MSKFFDPTDSTGVDRNVLTMLYMVIEDQTGLPPCEELKFHVHEDFARRMYKIVIRWPGNYETQVDVSQRELQSLRTVNQQFQMLADHTRRMSRQWLAAIQ